MKFNVKLKKIYIYFDKKMLLRKLIHYWYRIWEE